jgi:hypothetical protein
METKSDADRWTGGVTLSYAFNPSFTHRLIFGTDAVNEQKSRFFPYAGNFGPAGVTNGQRNIGLTTIARRWTSGRSTTAPVQR